VSVHIDADVVVAWERGRFDLVAWLEARPANEPISFSATAWQQLSFGKYAWEKPRAEKRRRHLEVLSRWKIKEFGEREADRAARLAAELKNETIGLADFQIAASALEDNAELLTFNVEHFQRVPGLRLARA